MFTRAVVLPALVNLAIAFFQQDYYIKYERHSVNFYNKDYFENFNLTYYFHNRSTRLLSWSCNVIKRIGTDMKFMLQTYKFVSQEYRYFPVFYEENPCVAVAIDKFGSSMKNFDTNLKSCPIEKGYYYLKRGLLNESSFPPYAPRGRFMFEVKFYDKNILLINASVFIKVAPTDPLEIVKH
ncbi:hypothetical protein FQR65_LT09326 [Abscondita terminalis]|nr:hypothetical protein FQR65_LT09326 [Abscondita terminalis]